MRRIRRTERKFTTEMSSVFLDQVGGGVKYVGLVLSVQNDRVS